MHAAQASSLQVEATAKRRPHTCLQVRKGKGEITQPELATVATIIPRPAR
ncbi:hypothetical protein ACS15_1160 [Ralstonia insidiosa]|uniref:Uncharacterized protein n=1 Tax=Ralstonia insidiosa TaxID=190721 RepID=A0AAC9FQH2_9RALS|nr:hypothetical protein ACS15_1160 [Ralstonia insidiosa]